MDIVSYAKSKSYTEETVDAAGWVKGAPCEIQSINPITGGHRITFQWEGTSGTVYTDTLDVLDGTDGQDGTDGISIVDLEVDTSNNHLMVELSSGVVVDAGEVPTVEGEKGDPGEDGFSPTITVKTETSETYILTVTTADGSFDTPNLRGRANSIADLEDVVVSNPQNGQTLVYNATLQKFINQNGGADIESLGDIADVDLANLQDGQVIKWDAANSKWVNADATNPTQYTTMENAADHPLELVQYIGVDTADYKRGYFYRSNPSVVSGEIVYNWEQIDVQPSNDDYEQLLNLPQINNVELSGNQSLDDLGINGKFQYTTLPAASSDIVSKIVQYIGATTQDYQKGYWYQVIYDAQTTSYVWQNIDVSSNAALASRISTLEDNQGDMSTLAVTGASDLVAAINALNGRGLSSITYVEPNLILTYADSSTITFNVKTQILAETQLGELANVNDATIANTNVLQYDSAILGYKPYDIVNALSTLLQSAKDYTDQEIASAVQNAAISCDAKPQYDAVNDQVIYFQDGVAHTTSHTDTRFYYMVDDDAFCSSWISGVEYTYNVKDIDLDTFVSKVTDIVSTYNESMADKTKVPDIAAIDTLLGIIKTDYLALKVNTADIVDNLLSNDATKPLSAKQGKEIKSQIDEKQDIIQFTTMPVIDSTMVGQVAQYIGTSSQAYKKGSFYEAVSDGESTPTYSWDEVEFAPDMVAMTTAEVDALWA